MKTKGILNSDISRVLSYMRHTDMICIGDCGLPCPDDVELIDLSVSANLPSFLQVLDAVLSDYTAEEYYLAEEMDSKSNIMFNKTKERMGKIPCRLLSHEELKEKTKECKAVIRTGEMTPYSNIILKSACIF